MTTYRVIFLGAVWWPYRVMASTERTYQADNDEKAIKRAYGVEAGDFSSVKGVMVLARVTCSDHGLLPHSAERMVKDWDNEDNEMAYLDTISSDYSIFRFHIHARKHILLPPIQYTITFLIFCARLLCQFVYFFYAPELKHKTPIFIGNLLA